MELNISETKEMILGQ